MENTIYGLFKEKVLQQPEATAIIENKRTLSFKELSAMVDMIADSFPDNTRAVGIVMRHRAEMIVSILAVLKTGAMYIPDGSRMYRSGDLGYILPDGNILRTARTRPALPLRTKQVRSWAAAGSATRARCPRPITPPVQTDIS